MDAIEAFCSDLVREGRVVFAERPVSSRALSTGAAAVLASAFAVEARNVAGAPIVFDETVACEAAELVRQACWSAVCHDEAAERIRGRFVMPRAPRSASHHLSADLTFRYLPQLMRRARALGPSDPLVGFLSELMRQWPLSGVLSDVREAPVAALDFGGHDGLMLLYAERLLRHTRPAWVPDRGRPREYAALVFQEAGRTLPPPAAEVICNA